MSIEVLQKAPSLQHAVKKLGPTPQHTARQIIEARDTPFVVHTFRARKYIVALLKGLSLDAAMQAATKEPHPHIRKAALEMLPLVADFMKTHDLRWFREIPPIRVWLSPTVYSSANPIGIARLGDRVFVIWPQTWKYDSLDAFQFNLLMTIMKRQFIDQYDEIDDVAWIEMSAPSNNAERLLNVRDITAARMLTDEELNDVGKNVEAALAIVEATPSKKAQRKKPEAPEQGGFDF